MMRLPKTLKREPLVEALFEMRMTDTSPLADILSGFLLHDYSPDGKITRLPAADIPHPMRKSDPNLQFAPIQCVDIEGLSILIGDSHVVVSCKLPYPKWPKFKTSILGVVEKIAKINLLGAVERYSVKYVNLIQAPTHHEQIKKIAMEIRLGDVEMNHDHVSLRVIHIEDDVAHIMSISTGAIAQLNGKDLTGVLVDVDSIREVNTMSINDFTNDLCSDLETLRQANKAKFFSCLTKETIQEMGPSYE